MAYVNAKGHTCLVQGDRIILQEKHQNCLYTFEKGEECEIKCARPNGDNYYALISLDGEKRIDGVILGGLTDGSIQITHNIPVQTQRDFNSNNLGGEILLQMFRFIGA